MTKTYAELEKLFESPKKTLAVALTLLLFFIAKITGFIGAVKNEFLDVELPPYSVEFSLLLFCIAIVLLMLSMLTWTLSLSGRAFKSVLVLLGGYYQAQRSAYASRQLFKRHIANEIVALSLQETAFLELFCADGMALQRMMTYELLPAKTYSAKWDLIKKGFIIETVIKNSPVSKNIHGKCFPIIEGFSLEAKTIPSLRSLFYGGKKPLTEIGLPLNRVAAYSGSSRGGAEQSVRRFRSSRVSVA